VRDYPFSVPANDGREEGVAGDFIRVKSATGTIRILAEYDGGAENMEMDVGDVLKLKPGKKFNGFRVVNETGSTITGVLVVGEGDFRREANITIAKPTTAASGNVPCLATASTVVQSAVSSRHMLRISSDVGNSSVLKIAEAPSAQNGIDLFPGQTVPVTFTGVVRAYNPSGVAQQISFFEERD